MVKLSHTELQKLFRDIFNYVEDCGNPTSNPKYWQETLGKLDVIRSKYGDTRFINRLLVSCYAYFSDIFQEENKTNNFSSDDETSMIQEIRKILNKENSA